MGLRLRVRAEKELAREDVDEGKVQGWGNHDRKPGCGYRWGSERSGGWKWPGVGEEVRSPLLGKVRASPQRVWSRQPTRAAPASWQMMAYPLRTWQRSSSCSMGSRAAHRSDTQCLGGWQGQLGAIRDGGARRPSPTEEALEAPPGRVRVCVCV